jgi:hypothetical protein
MSAFIVHPMVRSRILRWLGKPGHHSMAEQVCQAADVPYAPNWQIMLDVALWRMNAEAVSQRYGEPWDWAMYTPAPETSGAESLQVFRDIACYLYQCAEGDVEETPLYRAMGDLQDYVAREIVFALPGYQDTVWDWDGLPYREVPCLA